MPNDLRQLVRLARPHQWVKGGFIVIGPLYGGAFNSLANGFAIALAVLAFGLVSSACYIINDLQDRDADRAHPRKRLRPLAAGLVTPRAAAFMALGCFIAGAAAAAAILLLPLARPSLAAGLLGLCLAVYAANVIFYSLYIKHLVILDVIALALGFVLRVLGGCAAIAIMPSTWLLNVTFFLAMFLAFGKRLGERRTTPDANAARAVQAKYTDDLLRMTVVVTGVATLLTYAGYVQATEVKFPDRFQFGFNLLWLTTLPATYGLLRCIVLLEKGVYDDPTQLASKDRPFQLAAAIFLLMTAALLYSERQRAAGTPPLAPNTPQVARPGH